MVVDIHTHTFPERIAASTIQKLQDISHTRPFTDGTEAGLRASMVAAGVDFSLVLPVATSPRQVVHINDASARLNSQGNGILSFGCMHPDFDGWKEELGRVAALGMKGIKVHPVYQGVDFDDPRYLRILDRCGELGLIVLTHAGLDTAYALGRIAHRGDGHFAPEELALMSKAQFLRMVDTFGAHRILFGTDSPWRGQEEGIAQLRALPLSQPDLEAILGGNAQRLLGLS